MWHFEQVKHFSSASVPDMSQGQAVASTRWDTALAYTPHYTLNSKQL